MEKGMEKFSRSKKILNTAGKVARNTVAGVGLSAMGLVSTALIKHALEEEERFPENNKLELPNEWSRNQLESNKNITREVASILAKESLSEHRKEIQDMILMFDRWTKEDMEELKIREKTGKSTEGYSLMTNQDILYSIEYNKREKEVYQRKLEELFDKTNKKEDEVLYTKEVKEKLNYIKKVISYYDIGRQWVLDNIKDPKYQERLEKEFSDEDKTNKDLESFIKENYGNRIKEASDKDFILSKDIAESYREKTGNKGSNVAAFYGGENEKTYFPLQTDSLEAIQNAIHEYAHKVTEANNYLTSKSIKLFSESFDSLSVAANLTDKKNKDFLEKLAYYSDPTEIYARKKVFEYDLERLGVKKYGEEFTMKHYLKALQLREEGKLNYNSDEFLFIIKPKMIIKVMNEIAEENPASKKDTNLT